MAESVIPHFRGNDNNLGLCREGCKSPAHKKRDLIFSINEINSFGPATAKEIQSFGRLEGGPSQNYISFVIRFRQSQQAPF